MDGLDLRLVGRPRRWVGGIIGLVRGDVVGRDAEQDALRRLLGGTGSSPAGLAFWGEAGIGKTTIWAAGISTAQESGYTVSACQPTTAELRLTYSGLADLLTGVSEAVFEGLTLVQRRALDAALLRGRESDAAPDPRAVATACLSVINQLATLAPLLVAIDDVQWLDEPTRRVVAFAMRRCRGPIALLTAERSEDTPEGRNDLCPPDPTRLSYMRVGPLSVGALHHVVHNETGRSFPRPTMLRIAAVSAGNPFFAVEIARSLTGRATGPPTLPGTLRQVVDERIGTLAPEVRDALMAASALAEPSLALVGRTSGADDVALLLAPAEDSGVVDLSGGRVRFTHPLWAEGVYRGVGPARRRMLHQQLSQLVEDVEERARHLALGAIGSSEETARALDAAADHARSRGAASAAAELLELAIALDPIDPARRVRAARDHFDADDPGRARELLEGVVADLAPCRQRAEALALLGTVIYENDDYGRGVEMLERAFEEAADDRGLRCNIALELGMALVNSGRLDAAWRYSRVAVHEAETLGNDGLLAEALAGREVMRFMQGGDVDEGSLARALTLEDPDYRSHAVLWPSLNAAMIHLWTHQIERARADFSGLHDRCVERGSESDLWFVLAHATQLALWCGDTPSAERHLAEITERARMAGGDTTQALARAVAGVVAAWRGRVEEARAAASEAVASLTQSRFAMAVLHALGALGMVELSLGDAGAAAEYLAPAAAQMMAFGVADPALVPFWPDAAEALVALGRLDEAEPIVEYLEASGQRSTRIWARAVGARCRGLLSAARGDLNEAAGTYQRSLAAHAELPAARYDRARTLLVTGKLQRRRGQRRAARSSLEEAGRLFDDVGTDQWAIQARAELDRLGARPGPTDRLSPTEQHVAVLAASGLTNREVAAALFISPKTVEANLARAYRKLGIHSRAELGRHIALTPVDGRPTET